MSYRATLAWVTAFPSRDGWRKIDIFNEQYVGAAERARKLGCSLEHFWLAEPAMTPARASQILAARGISGLIMAPMPNPQGSVDLDWERFSAVAVGISLSSPALHVASAHQYRCIRLALHELEQRGYRRIGLALLKSSDDRVDNNWLAGYLTRQFELSNRGWPAPLLLPAWNEQVFTKWVRSNALDAVVTKLPRALQALIDDGVSVPDDVGLAFLGEIPPESIYSGVNENPRQVGTAAVDFVLGMIHRNERGVPTLPQRLLIDGAWIDGKTVRSRPVTVGSTA